MADFSITGEVKLNSDPAEKSVSKWTVAAGQMIADFAKQAASKLSEVVKSGVQYNATMQSYLTNFQVMLGSEEQAAQKLAEIRKMAAATPFSLSDLTNGTQTLLQFGIAADDTTGVLKKLGDISLGNADKMQTLVRAYGKMSSAQKVTLENVNMMIDAGFNPLNQICDATGETMSALYQRITDGKVPFSELEAAVEAATSQGGQFFNGMLEASQTYDEVVDGALVTVEKVTTIAADGTRQVAEQIKESAADSFDGLWAELQAQANDGVLGTFDELYKAVKNKNWAQVGQWVAATLYNGLAADQKKQIADFALGLVDKLNEALGQVQGQVAQAAWDLGSQLCQGVTSGFSQILAQAKTLGGTLTGIFKGLKEPLSTAALAISQGLSGGLLSAFPAIYAGMGTMIGSVGAAFEGMLTAISAALNATVFGIPMGVIVAGAAVALGVAIAAIVAGLGGRKGSSSRPSGGSGGSGGGSSGSLGSVDITTGTGSLEEAITANTAALTKTNAALADMIRQAGALVLSDNMRLGSTVAASGTAQVAAAASSYHREGDTTINQYIQSKAQTAADLARETRWEADKARRDKR